MSSVSRLNFWLIWAVGVVPMLIAMMMYFFGVMLPADRTHTGELLQGEHLHSWQLRSADNSNKPQWQLLLTTPQDCLQNCDHWWQVLDKVHTALGKDQGRVLLARIESSHSELSQPDFNRLGAAVWIADPKGNLVLRYSLDEQPKQVLKDLRKLLKVSRIG